MNLYDETDVLGNEPAPHPIAADAALSAMLAASPQPAAPVAECTNEDSWNCKYCRKTETCAALKDERNFGAPPKAARQEQGDEVRRLREALETERQRLAACGVAALGYFDGCADEYKSASLSDVLSLRTKYTELLSWAVGRWEAEVKNRPLVNVHRRSLDDTWRQVIRQLGGDPVVLCGPDHDTLSASAEGKV